MNIQDCIKFANKNPVCFVATVDGGKPRVRAFGMWRADDSGFYFQCGANKAVTNQMIKNPNIEVCFYEPSPAGPGTMLRIAGEAEFLNDHTMKAQLLEERPFLRMMGISGPDDPELALFRITKGEAWFWELDANMQPIDTGVVKF